MKREKEFFLILDSFYKKRQLSVHFSCLLSPLPDHVALSQPKLSRSPLLHTSFARLALCLLSFIYMSIQAPSLHTQMVDPCYIITDPTLFPHSLFFLLVSLLTLSLVLNKTSEERGVKKGDNRRQRSTTQVACNWCNQRGKREQRHEESAIPFKQLC